MYGTVAVQFELLTSTILFLSREGIGNGLLHVWPQKRKDMQSDKSLQAARQCANLVAAVPYSTWHTNHALNVIE